MADKKLLEESTIRRFMELANIKPSEKGMLSETKDRVANSRSDRKYAGFKDEESNNTLGGMMREKKHKKVEEEQVEEAWDMKEETVEEADEPDMGADAGVDMDMPTDDMGGEADAEGGDLESAVEDVVSALNRVFTAAGLDKEVELDSGSEEGPEGVESGEEEVGGMEDEGGAPMMEKKNKMQEEDLEESESLEEEELEESIELVDDSLIEKLVKRVSDRLVAEARKSKKTALAEASSGWGEKGMHANASKSKNSTKGKGPGKGKKSTPFTKSVSVKGMAGRGR